MLFNKFNVYNEFAKFGITVAMSDKDKLMVESVPKISFAKIGYTNCKQADKAIEKMASVCGKESLAKDHLLATAVAKNNFQHINLSTLEQVTENILSTLFGNKIALNKHALIKILPSTEYGILENLVRRHEKDTLKKCPDYYKNSSALLLNSHFIFIKDTGSINIGTLDSIVHEVGHLCLPVGDDLILNEYYAYIFEFIFFKIFNDGLLNLFPKAKPVKIVGGGTTSESHNKAFALAEAKFKELTSIKPL